MKIGKIIIMMFFSLSICSNLLAQSKMIRSGIYSWVDYDKNGSEIEQLMVSGETVDLKELDILSITLSPNDKIENTLTQEKEIFIIVKNGIVNITIEGNSKVVGKGSVAIVLPTNEYIFANSRDSTSQFYLFSYVSKSPVDIDRGLDNGGSIIVDWDDLEFKPHDKGGIRNYFERATAMFHRFEMHVTTLNPGINSHDPHTHTSDEMVLMIDGEATLQVGDNHFDAVAGDLVFLEANKPHALNNVSSKQCMYFAFHAE